MENKEKDFDALKKLAEETKKITLEELAEKAEHLKELLPDDEEITERSFKMYFLPLIDGRVEPTEENIKTFLDNIKIVTGSVHRGLKIIDDKTGEELFRLPPIMLSLDDDNTALENFSFSVLIRKQLLAEENPLSTIKKEVNAAMNYISKVSLPEKEQLMRYAEGILKMYERYNLIPKEIKDKVKTTTNTEEDDIGDYLDLD